MKKPQRLSCLLIKLTVITIKVMNLFHWGLKDLLYLVCKDEEGTKG